MAQDRTDARFEVISPEDLEGNPFAMIGKQWMLISAGMKSSLNPMTASWGGLGVLWNRPVAYCFIRPSRHTFKVMDQNPVYSICFLPEEHREILNYCGSHSGRSVNKIAECRLDVIEDESGGCYYAQADVALICRRLYQQDLEPTRFLDSSIESNYRGTDYHRFYVGEVIKCLQKERKYVKVRKS